MTGGLPAARLGVLSALQLLQAAKAEAAGREAWQRCDGREACPFPEGDWRGGVWLCAWEDEDQRSLREEYEASVRWFGWLDSSAKAPAG